VNLPGLASKPSDLNRPVLEVEFPTGTGELVRLDLATGEIDWSVELDTMPFGAATISNDLLFTTLFDGRLVAHSLDDGSEVWSTQLPAGTNSPVAIAGDWLVTAAGFPQGEGQKPGSWSSSSAASASRLRHPAARTKKTPTTTAERRVTTPPGGARHVPVSDRLKREHTGAGVHLRCRRGEVVDSCRGAR